MEGIGGGTTEGLGSKAERRFPVTEASLGFWRLSLTVEADEDCEEVAVARVVEEMVLVQSERGFGALSLLLDGSASISFFCYFIICFFFLLLYI